MTPSKFLVISSFSLLFGVAFGSLVSFSWLIVFILFLIGLIFLILASQKNHKIFLAIALVIIFALIGLVRASLPSDSGSSEEISFFSPVRQILIDKSAEVIGGPEQAMFSAMVLGFKDDLSNEVKEIFNRTGTRHILAISGMHLTIVSVILLQILILIGFFRRQAFWLALLGILAFILLVGAPPSAVRAGIMAGLYLTARQIGRMSQAWRLLLVAAVIMVIIQPRLLLFGVGFQLSFLAVLGIIFFKPFFDSLVKFVPFETVRNLLSLSLAAQLTTWPIVAKNFGTVALVGPIANLVAVPLLPVIMMLGLSFVVFGWWNVLVAKILLWPAWVILHFIFSFISQLSSFKYASVELGSLSLIIVFGYYALLLIFYRVFKKKRNVQFSV